MYTSSLHLKGVRVCCMRKSAGATGSAQRTMNRDVASRRTSRVYLRAQRSLRNSKRAEGAIIANLIIFVGVMALSAAAIALFKTLYDTNANEVTAASTRTSSVLKTDFAISSVAYSSGTIYVYAKNTGTKQFDPDDLDIYIDEMRIPRNVTNRTVTVTTDTDTINAGIWDQKEEVEFNVYHTYSTPETHTVRIATPNGVSVEGDFSS